MNKSIAGHIQELPRSPYMRSYEVQDKVELSMLNQKMLLEY